MTGPADLARLGVPSKSYVQSVARRRRPYRILAVGDSIAAWRETPFTVPSMTDNGDGTVTLNFASDKGFYAGDPIRITAATSTQYNVLDGTVLSATGTGPVTVSYTGARVAPVTGGAGQMTAYRVYSANGCGFLTAMQFFAQQGFQVTHCCAGGAKAADALAMITDSKLSLKAGDIDLIVCNVGTNDLYSGARTDTATIADLKALFDQFDKLACAVAVLLIPPRISLTDSTKRGYHANVNRWLWDECLKRGYRPVDSWRAQWNGLTFIDSSSATAAPATNMLQLGTDNTHPDITGGLALGSELWNTIKDLFPNKSRWLPASPCNFTTSTNLLGDTSWGSGGGTSVAGSGTITNGANIPSGWTLQHTSGAPTVTCSLTPRTIATDGDALGNRFSMVFSSITGATNTRLYKQNLQSLFSSLVGQKVKLRIPVEGKSLAALSLLQARFWPTWGGFVHYTGMTLGNLYTFGGNFVGVLETPELVVPSGGFTAAEVRLDIGFASGGSGQIDVWQPEIVIVN